MKHSIQSIIVPAVLLIATSLAAETRTSKEVFGKWLDWQKLHSDVNLSDFADEQVSMDYARHLHGNVPEAARPQIATLLSIPAAPSPPDAEYAKMRNALRTTIEEIDDDVPDLVDRMRKQGFVPPGLDQREREGPFRDVTTKYRETLAWLLQPGDVNTAVFRRRALRVAAANRFFEYCFVDHHAHFRRLVGNKANHPIGRFLYANMWYNLSGDGWRVWHTDALARLREASADGDEIVYIAGGSDIYQPLLHGVRKLTVIDPMFPSQTKYYSEGWEFLIRGKSTDTTLAGVGDRIVFSEEEVAGGLVMIRRSVSAEGTIRTGILSNDASEEYPETVTVWDLQNAAGKRIGRFTLERRFAKQEDFTNLKRRRLLISFNELAYVAAAGDDGWGLDVEAFPGNFEIEVKQLRRPVSRRTMINIRSMNTTDFYYIKLGTSVD